MAILFLGLPLSFLCPSSAFLCPSSALSRSIDYNLIESIEADAFKGSYISQL